MATSSINGNTVDPKWTPFTITDLSYKTVGRTPLIASLLVPHQIKPGKVPVVVHWHGGSLIIGHRRFPEWYADWLLDFGLEHNAIVLTPDYRLMPEANGEDILQDIKDFHAWLAEADILEQYLPSNVTPDLDHMLVIGESAGGWAALQSGFVACEHISAIVAQYPMIDMRSPHFTQEYRKPLMEPEVPQIPRQVFDDHVSSLAGDEVITSRDPARHFPLMATILQTGLFGAVFGLQSELYPLEQLQAATTFPPTWILHGRSDNVVPVEGSEKFGKEFEQRLPDVPLLMTLRAGEGHGFDAHELATGQPATLGSDWVTEGINFVEQFWPPRSRHP